MRFWLGDNSCPEPVRSVSEYGYEMIFLGYESLTAHLEVSIISIEAASCMAPQESLESAIHFIAVFPCLPASLYAASSVLTNDSDLQWKSGMQVDIHW